MKMRRWGRRGVCTALMLVLWACNEDVTTTITGVVNNDANPADTLDGGAGTDLLVLSYSGYSGGISFSIDANLLATVTLTAAEVLAVRLASPG